MSNLALQAQMPNLGLQAQTPNQAQPAQMPNLGLQAQMLNQAYSYPQGQLPQHMGPANDGLYPYTLADVVQRPVMPNEIHTYAHAQRAALDNTGHPSDALLPRVVTPTPRRVAPVHGAASIAVGQAQAAAPGQQQHIPSTSAGVHMTYGAAEHRGPTPLHILEALTRDQSHPHGFKAFCKASRCLLVLVTPRGPA
jgi:hypothetical protein